jgi:hypothetical protein
MRVGPTTHSSNPPVTALKVLARPDEGRARFDAATESATLGRSNGRRTINPSFSAFLPPFFPVFTVQDVISRTSAPAAPRLHPAFAAASHQNAAVNPPLADRRRPAQSQSAVRSPRAFEVGFASHSPLATSHRSSLIYGTGIDFSSKHMQTKEKTFSNIR